MLVSEIMHGGVTTIKPTDTLKDAAILMKEEDIGSLPVYENGQPIGFLTDRDIVLHGVALGRSDSELVREAMSEHVVTIHPEQNLKEAMQLMAENQISRLLVIDEDESPMGMISLRDIEIHVDDEETLHMLSEIKRQ